MGRYGIGELTAVAILAELGDTRRFSSSRQAAGLDVTVHQSDQRRSPGHLSRQAPPALRWALYEAAQAARRPGSPDRAYYAQAAERLGGNRCDRRADDLTRRATALQATDPRAADALWARAERRVLAAAPAIPLLNPLRTISCRRASATISTTLSGACCSIKCPCAERDPAGRG